MLNRGVTLLEIIIVVIILSVLASLALPQFGKGQEEALKKEAISNLKIIQEAERLHELETGKYYPDSGTEDKIASINSYLKIALSSEASPKWTYKVKDTGCAQATRNIAGGNTLYLTINDTDGEPDSGSGCP